MPSILMELRKFETVFHRRIAHSMPSTDKGRLFHVQALVVNFLKENEGKCVCQRDVEAHLNIRSSSATKLLQRMEEKGFIVRTASKDDKRYKQIALTEKAERLWEIGLSKMDSVIKMLEKDVSPQEKELFLNVLKKLTSNANEFFEQIELQGKEDLC